MSCGQRIDNELWGATLKPADLEKVTIGVSRALARTQGSGCWCHVLDGASSEALNGLGVLGSTGSVGLLPFERIKAPVRGTARHKRAQPPRDLQATSDFNPMPGQDQRH
ncbi:hypothetical protein FOC1_g10013864 [Fusarium oxysporum f. sp. cubense race 1]|uniref:Uncharacterized protein n=1 Tax=Fusarium oxysporum f. sp. cubense (strain race 1) TaxID=1229664 RepID=N4U3T7_FUSC1|nr:hypothetical protein FOC1_g10013864 [Fusarium oxysporum f. sp. cubense race 1]